MKTTPYIIYGLFDPISRELRYVGKSSSGLKRPKTHLCPSQYLQQSTKLQCWIGSLIKNNKKPIIDVLQECTAQTLNEEEKFYICYMKSLGCDLCNHTDGGEGVLNPDESVRRKIGDKSVGRKTFLGRNHSEKTKLLLREQRLGERSPWFGKSHKAETRAKMSANSPRKRPIVDQNGIVYASQADASKKLNIETSGIEKQLSGKFKQIKGYVFKYLEVSIGG